MKLYIRRGLDSDDVDVYLVLERISSTSYVRGEFKTHVEADIFIKRIRKPSNAGEKA